MGVKDSPVDAPEDPVLYTDGIRRKFLAALVAATYCEAEVLVISDVGCGVFGNDPITVGPCLGEVLRQKPFANHFEQIIFTGNLGFAEAVKNAFAVVPAEVSCQDASALASAQASVPVAVLTVASEQGGSAPVTVPAEVPDQGVLE